MKGLKKLASAIALLSVTVSVPHVNAQTPLQLDKYPANSQITPTQTNPNQATENGRDTRSQLNEAFSLLKAKKYSQAINLFSQVIQVEPNNPYAYFGRGFSYFGLDEYQKAKVDLDKSINLNSQISYAYLFRGLTNYQLGNKQEAISDLQTAANLFEKDGNTEMAQKSLEIIGRIRNA